MALGTKALRGDRKSLPSLIMVSGELARALADRYQVEPEVSEYLDQVRTLKAS